MPNSGPPRTNGSLTRHRGQLLLAYRHGFPWSDIALCTLDEGYRVTGDLPVRWPRKRGPADAISDPRLFPCGGQLYCSYIHEDDGQTGCRQALCRISNLAGVEDREFPRAAGRSHEKNWQFFEHEGRMLFVYSIDPEHVVMDLGLSVVGRTPCPFGWEWGQPRGGTPPIRVGGEYVCFFHSHAGGRDGFARVYSAGYYAFEAQPPFRITRWSRRPLLVPDYADAPHRESATVFPAAHCSREGPGASHMDTTTGGPTCCRFARPSSMSRATPRGRGSASLAGGTAASAGNGVAQDSVQRRGRRTRFRIAPRALHSSSTHTDGRTETLRPEDGARCDAIYPAAGPLRIGLVIGTYASVPYVHLGLETWRRHCPHIEVLVHDDCSRDGDRLRELCREYGASFETNSVRKHHTVGDQSAFLGGLLWSRRQGHDILVKFSRRFVPLYDWTGGLAVLARGSQEATFSNVCMNINWGFRSEAVAMHARSSAPVVEKLRRDVVERENVFVEGTIHALAREIEPCPAALEYRRLHPAIPGARATASGRCSARTGS